MVGVEGSYDPTREKSQRSKERKEDAKENGNATLSMGVRFLIFRFSLRPLCALCAFAVAEILSEVTTKFFSTSLQVAPRYTESKSGE